MTIRRRALVLLLFTMVLAASPTQASAHGGGTPRLVNAPAGPYRISAWTQPDPVRTGSLHVSVAVSDAVSGAPVLNTTVEVAAARAGFTGAPAFSAAPRGVSPNKLFHEVDLVIDDEGEFQVTIRVSGPAGNGQNRFELEILPPARRAAGLLPAIAAALLIVMLLFIRNHSPAHTRQLPPTPSKEATL